ncbi:MAG: HEAT repeat domain-containing protein [Fimbriimonadaceae bacterium]
MIKRAAVLVALLPLGASAQLTATELGGLRDALTIQNWGIDDLKFPRSQFNLKPALLIATGLGDPLEASRQLFAAHESTKTGTLDKILVTAAQTLEGHTPANPAPLADAPVSLPSGLAAVVAQMVGALRAADGEVRTALSRLSPEEARELVEGLAPYAIEDARLSFSFVRSTPAPPERVRALLSKVDVKRIVSAGIGLAAASELAVAKLRSLQEDVPAPVQLTVSGLPVEVAGRANDTHTSTNARLVIDLGGDDTYRGRHGAGVGYSSVLIDVAGDDRYNVPDLSVGAAVTGIGLAYDLGGDDRFEGRTICFGAGLAGVGGFFKFGGHDEYRAVALAQGFALAGIGVCADTDGDDLYVAKLASQGSARTDGVGWLIDRKGADVYRAGGLFLNSPLFADVHYSFSQGFGQGYREDTGGWAGGIGLLSDHLGDDHYLGETYCQAASYWYSLGSLYDASGNDTYSAHHYAQASAMHLTSAYLFDLGGSDLYGVKYGASFAIGHDYGVAVMLDRAGNDIYAARDSTPGTGVANGLGLFVDSEGDDRYDGPPGFGQVSRGTGSLGIFVDVAGADKYREGLGDGQAQGRPTWALALDYRGAPPSQGGTPRPAPVAGSKPAVSSDEFARLFRFATQWGVGTAQQEVDDTVHLLSEIGLPAFEWMVENRLEGMDRLQRRCFVAVARALGSEAGVVLARKGLAGNARIKQNLLAIAVEAGLTDIGALVPPMLEQPETQLAAARAAGPLKASAAVQGLSRLTLAADPVVARAAAISLSQIASPESAGTAQALLRAPDPIVREAAISLLAKLGEQGKASARALAAEGDEARARQGLAILGIMGDPESLRFIASFLLDPRPGVRIEALRRLDGRCPQEYHSSFLGLRSDPVELVRLVATTVRPSP